MMTRTIDLRPLRKASDKLAGTHDYLYYHMECYIHSRGSRKWKFIGWGVPYSKTAILKKFNNTYYLYIDECDERWTVTEEVARFLGLEA